MAKTDTTTSGDATATAHPGDHEITYYARCAAAAGLVPPLLDVVAVTAVQLRMIKRLAAVYGADYDDASGRALIGAIVGSYLPARVGFGSVGLLIRSTPAVGPLLGLATVPAFNYASTWALGRVFARHFAEGGTLPDLDIDSAKRYYRDNLKRTPPATATATGTASI